METVESLIPPRDTGDSDPEWEKPDDDVALARATLVHNVHAHEDETANTALASFTALEVDDTSMALRLQEMEAAMSRLLAKGDEMVAVTGPEVPTTGDFVPEGGVSDDPMGSEEVPTTGDFVPEGGSSDDHMDRATDNKPRPYSALPAGTLEEKVFRIEGFPEDFPGIGKKSADLAQQLTKEEIVYQIYKRQLAQEKMLAAPYNRARRGVGHSSMGQLDPGSTGATLMCPNCFADWQRQDNKVEGKCKLCQKSVIAVDKGPPSAEIKLGSASWRMFCGPRGVTWHTDADEAQKEAASVDIGSWAQPPPRPTDQKELSFADQVPMALRREKDPIPSPAGGGDGHHQEELGPSRQTKKPTEEEFLDHINPQLDVIVEMQAGAQSVEEAKGASILRQLDTEKLRSLLKRNYLQGPGNQGEEFFSAQTTLEEAKASNKRMQDEGSQRAQILRPVADSIDTWGTQLRAFGPEEQSPEAVLGVAVGSVEFQILRLKRIIELHMGEQRMIGGKWKQLPGPLEEIEAQVAMGTRPPLDKIIGPFHAEGEGNTHWQKEVQTWDLVSLFSCFGHTYLARHLYAVWSHLPITIKSHKRGAKNKQQNLQRRDDHRELMKEAKEFVILHDLPVPTTNQEWKQLYREIGSFFAAKVFINRTPQVVLDLPVSDIHDSKQHMRLRAVCDERITLPLKAFRHFPEIYNSLSHSLGQDSVVEVKMAWRCNTVQWWTARLTSTGPTYPN
ncbi:cpt [Symbiodinium sp. CCMP2592]|nr:cpt [Symbiodinium sp. CCMP2592]